MGEIVDWFWVIIGFIFATFIYASIALYVTGHWIIATILVIVLLLLVGLYLLFLRLSYPG